MKELAKTLLEAIGYVISEPDKVLLDAFISKVENEIKTFCNIKEIPNDFFYEEATIVVGEFLNMKYKSGALALNKMVFDGIKSVTEGDTSITFGDSAESKISAYIADCLDWHDKATKYRKMVW